MFKQISKYFIIGIPVTYIYYSKSFDRISMKYLGWGIALTGSLVWPITLPHYILKNIYYKHNK